MSIHVLLFQSTSTKNPNKRILHSEQSSSSRRMLKICSFCAKQQSLTYYQTLTIVFDVRKSPRLQRRLQRRITPRYSWNIAKVVIKHQSVNQSIKEGYKEMMHDYSNLRTGPMRGGFSRYIGPGPESQELPVNLWRVP